MVLNELFLQAAATGGGFSMMIPLILIVLIMYFFMIRPQSKKQKETQKMIDALKKGDKVVTIGGIHGTITQAKEKTVIVKVDDNTKIEFNRTAIATVTFEKPVSEADKKAGEADSSSEGSENVPAEKSEEQKKAEAKAKKYAKIRMIVVLVLLAAFVFSMIFKNTGAKKAEVKEAQAVEQKDAAPADAVQSNDSADTEGFDTVAAETKAE